ncbi:MAG: hypothetical protein J6125_02090 [Clostridia bacterium]|nr:hypothetical protein [Clostridia bacterium]
MSNTVSLRRLTRRELTEHGRKITQALLSDEAYRAAAERARAIGVETVVSIRETFTDAKRDVFRLPEDDEIPFGYAAELRVDLCRDGRILFVRDESGAPNQMTCAYTVIYTPETLIGKKLTFLEFDEIDGGECIADYIEDYLDLIEEDHGGMASVLYAENACPDVPAREPEVIFDPVRLTGEDVVEFQAGPFSGSYLVEGSAFVPCDVFRPLTLILESARFGTVCDHGVTAFRRDEWEAFAARLRQAVELVRRAPCFSEVLSGLELYALDPTDKEEKWLDAVTCRRPEQFCRMAEDLLRWADEALTRQNDPAGAVISALWP